MARPKKSSVKEKYEDQLEKARIRQRRRLQTMTDEQKEAKKKYDRERIARLREEKKLKRIGDMTDREKKNMRKYWRERNRARASKKKAEAEELVDTPPSPASLVEHEVDKESSQKKRGRKKVRKDKAKVYRTVNKQKEKIKDLEKQLRKYKKRIQRLKENKNQTPNVTLPSPSPRKKVQEILGKEKVSPTVKRQLFLGIALHKQIKQQQKRVSGSKKKNQIIHKVIGNELLKKYRIQKHFKDILPYRTNKVLLQSKDEFSYSRKPKICIRKTLSSTVVKFFEDDRISRMCPGKKDVVKKGAIKKQRRVLLDSMDNLRNKFVKETNIKISRASFFRFRPFWVTFPKPSDRDTCACVKHSNMQFLIAALKKTNVITERTSREVIKSVVCPQKKRQCMLSTCNDCRNKFVAFHFEQDFSIKYNKWVSVKEEKTIKNKKKIIKKTVKCTETKKVSELENYFKKELELFKKHVYYEQHQSNVLKTKTENLKSGELIFRIDFSENYVAKFSEEVQSIHFGASKKQISLNTGVRFALVEGTVPEVHTLCFASASDHLDHQAHAVWAHMRPILEQTAKDFPDTHTVHVFSDSPSSQYRNRTNVYLFKTNMLRYFPNLHTLTWNYTEAGHGKGEMDGVGGTLKRGADRKVSYGADITCAKEFVSELKDFNISLYEIPSADIDEVKAQVAQLQIPPITGIMQVHQITYSKGGPMFCNTLSCFKCPPSDGCSHFRFSEICLDGDSSQSTVPKKNVISTKKRILTVEDVFTSSDNDSDNDEAVIGLQNEVEKPGERDILSMYGSDIDNLEGRLVSGVHVIVQYNVHEGKKCTSKLFIGVCQGELKNNEIEVMFLKPCDKDTHSLYVVNESDVASVPVNQVKALLPTPTIILKGNRVFYKFMKNVL